MSPSFFLNCSYARPNLSPSIKTPPSNLGSTCMQKYLDSLQSNDEGTTKALTSFNSHVDQMGFLLGNEPVQELSPTICKREAIMEEKILQNKRSRQKKNPRDEVRRVFKRPSSEIENGNGSTELTKVLDNIIQDLRVKQDQPMSNKPTMTFQFSQEDYDFESEQEEGEKELLTEEESIKVLKSFRHKSFATLQFMAEIEKHSKIPNTLVIGEGRRMKKDPVVELKSQQKKIISFNKNEISIPLEISKKILKSSGRAAYECKYCGKSFTKGCSLGGHISRLHKGESLDFKQRLQTRNKRVADRVRGKFLKKESVKQLQSLENH